MNKQRDVDRNESRMIPYQNLSGNSGVTSYRIDDESIDVEFNYVNVYQYTYQAPGRHKVEQMKTLALSGQGLHAFINIHVKKNYAAKLR